MLVGTDISIAECRNEGYAVVDTKGLMKGGVLQKDVPARVTISFHPLWKDGRPRIDLCPSKEDLYLHDIMISFEDLVERFGDHGQDIKDFCDWDACPMDFDSPTPYTMAHLAETISAYCGLG